MSSVLPATRGPAPLPRALRTLATLAACTAVCMTGSAQAQSFPGERPIVAVVPFSAGGPTDRVAREAARILGRSLGAKVVVENLGGAGGTIGTAKVVKAAADGHTILIHNIGVATAPALYPKLGFDPATDLEPIGELVDVPMVLVGHKSLPVAGTEELLRYLRAQGPAVAFGNAGAGSAAQLCGLLLLSRFKLETLPVAYKGSAPALADLVGGHTQVGCDQTTNLAGHLRAGTLKSFAAMQERRIQAFPDIPAAPEQGLGDLGVRVWHAVFVPKGTPPAVRARIERALQDVVQDDEFRKSMAEVGAEAVPVARASQGALRAHLAQQIGLWGPIIRNAGVQAD